VIEDDDPNEAYDVEPIPAGEPQSSLGWWVCKQNGIGWWYGPRDVVEKLAVDPVMRASFRASKMHHDRKPV